MKTNVSEASIEAYQQHINSGAKLKQREAILAYMDGKSPATRRQIAGGLGFELGATAGRVNKLVEDGLLVDYGTMKCSTTGKTVGVVGFPDIRIG